MKRICAHCLKEHGFQAEPPPPGNEVTHGICQRHMIAEANGYGFSATELAEMLKTPEQFAPEIKSGVLKNLENNLSGKRVAVLTPFEDYGVPMFAVKLMEAASKAYPAGSELDVEMHELEMV